MFPAEIVEAHNGTSRTGAEAIGRNGFRECGVVEDASRKESVRSRGYAAKHAADGNNGQRKLDTRNASKKGQPGVNLVIGQARNVKDGIFPGQRVSVDAHDIIKEHRPIFRLYFKQLDGVGIHSVDRIGSRRGPEKELIPTPPGMFLGNNSDGSLR